MAMQSFGKMAISVSQRDGGGVGGVVGCVSDV